MKHHTGISALWLAGWLFTIGYLQLAFWPTVAAALIWPYYLGTFFGSSIHF